MIRFLFLLHRYLGIVVGLVMLIWTLSGIIMMYKEYPELNHQQQLAVLNELRVGECCALPNSNVIRSEEFRSARIEMLSGIPVLRLNSSSRGLLTYDLQRGARINNISANHAEQIATKFSQARYPDSPPQLIGQINTDQWTVYGAYNPLRPLYKYSTGDSEDTEFYISSQTGEVVQVTTSSQRLWGYLGAVIHWLYPTVLRQNTALWSQVVIWLTILGIFLTATGLYIGIRQYRNRNNRRKSPYRGMALYHHYAGLVFGVLTLTWVSSGLLSMNPWGTLEGEGAGLEVQRLTQRPIQWTDIETVVAQVPQFDSENVVRLEISVLNGAPQVIAHSASGKATRLDARSLQAQALGAAALVTLAEQLRPGAVIASQALITESDAYYYDHHIALEFPAYRVIMDDEQRRHYYLSPVSGQLLRKIDSELRMYRWFFYGLHRGDFSTLLRSRPVWDGFMLLFLLGVTLVCGTGSYMAIRRLRRDLALNKHRSNSVASYSNGLEEY